MDRYLYLYRLLGDFDKAADSYREAIKWNRNPQPGLALLRLAQDRGDIGACCRFYWFLYGCFGNGKGGLYRPFYGRGNQMIEVL
ncbi:tetratricopeptide repeat protein [Membranicola marinus]|uniref:Tetratricopeptide repeat protein n=1 Tax=Membranihabitans marinus TaxID=1227546 RepID=A0A953I174_9BACT|nr:tetratricopeptide repeat protein [Membranihabitans marinus]